MLKKLWLSFVLVCVLVTGAWAEVYPQRFHVQGNKIVGEDGQVAMMRGFQADEWWEDIFEHKYVSDSWVGGAYNRMRQWGATIVRINVVPMKIRQLGMQAMMDEIEKIVGQAKLHHMYVVLSYHTVGFVPNGNFDQTWYPQVIETTVPEVQEFWTEASKRFSGNKTVAFYELINESTQSFPGATHEHDWQIWKGFCDDLVNRIRANDNETIIIVSGLRWACTLEGSLTMPINDSNVAYAVHPYPWTGGEGPTQNGMDNLDVRWSAAAAKYPLIVTELAFMDEGDGTRESRWPGPGRFRDDIINYLEQRGMSWMAFTHRIGQENVSFNMTYNDGVTLKEIGQHWRSKAIPYVPKGKVKVKCEGTWTIDGGDTKTYQSEDMADVVTYANYKITTSDGKTKEVWIENENETKVVDFSGGGSGGGGGGCNIGVGVNPILIPILLLCSFFLMRRKNK